MSNSGCTVQGVLAVWSQIVSNSGSTVQAVLESREMNEQIGWRAKQPPQAACVFETLNCLGLETLLAGIKPKDITHQLPRGGG